MTDKYDTAHFGKQGGRPSLEQEAENAHVKAEVRIDKAMAQGVAPVLKELKRMFADLPAVKENLRWPFLPKIYR